MLLIMCRWLRARCEFIRLSEAYGSSEQVHTHLTPSIFLARSEVEIAALIRSMHGGILFTRSTDGQWRFVRDDNELVMTYSLGELIKHARAYSLDIKTHILERGLGYWQQGALREIERLPCGGLFAIVAGSEDYEVVLELVPRGRDVVLRGSCDCPYWDTCKHVGALFVEFITRENGHPHADTAVAQYLEALTAMVMEDEPSKARSRLQLTMARRPNRTAGGEHFIALTLTPYILRIGKKGKPLKPQLAFNSYGAVLNRDMHTDHFTLLQWLDSMTQRYSGFRQVEVPALAVGRLLDIALYEAMLVDAAEDTPMARGEKRHIDAMWQEQNGKHLLGWHLDNQALSERLQLIPAGEIFWYVDLDQGLMGEAEGAFSVQQVAAASRLPRLSHEQRERVEADIVEKFSAPKVLALSRASDAPEKCVPLCGKLIRIDSDTNCFEPIWLYEGDISLQANPDCERSYLKEQQFWLLRDVDAESAALDEFVEISGVKGSRRDERGDLTLIPESDFSWPQFSLDVVPKLEVCGWQIELPDSHQYIANDAFELNVDMDEQSAGGWWFEVGFSVEFEGQKLQLVPILSEWIARFGLGEGPLEGLPEEEMFPLKVDEEGHVWRVPVKLMRTLLNQFADLLHDAEGERLRLPNAAMGQLDEVLDDLPTLPWEPPAKLKTLASGLRASRDPVPLPAPEGFHAQLRPYQQVGVGWLQFLADTGMNGVLADDMGLGKTVQTLAHIVYQRRAKPEAPPVLVVAPTSVVGNWRREILKFAPDLKQLMLYGPKRQAWFERMDEFDIVMTSYALLQRDREVLAAQPFSLVVLDEAQWIKNPRAKTSLAAKALQTERRLCLSGTPMENHTGELWSLFDFLMPGFLGSEKRFKTMFRTPIEKNGDADALARLRGRTAPLILRRDKQLVAADLPDRNEMVQSVEMGTGQKAVYEAVRARMEKKVRQALESKGLGQSHIMVLEALLKLRQCCCDPRLLPSRTAGRDRAKSAKLELLMELLPTLVEEGRRVLLFSQFTTMLDLISTELQSANIDFIKLTGRTRNRDALVEQFQTGEVPVFLISLKAGGVGLNLTAADTVIIYDPWWNPAVEQQAIDRAHRIGQDKSVFVYRLITEGSIEEKILQLQEQKKLLTSGVLEDTGAVPIGLSEDQVLELLQPM